MIKRDTKPEFESFTEKGGEESGRITKLCIKYGVHGDNGVIVEGCRGLLKENNIINVNYLLAE